MTSDTSITILSLCFHIQSRLLLLLLNMLEGLQPLIKVTHVTLK